MTDHGESRCPGGRGYCDSPGGFCVPTGIPWLEESLRLDLARIMRNGQAIEAARRAGAPTYLHEGFLGAKSAMPVPAPPAPPTRRELLEERLIEARRRIRAAVYVLRTGDTSNDDD